MTKLCDSLMVLGAALVIAGLWWTWPPLALVAAGCGSIGLGWLLWNKHKRR